ncbi:MAG: ArgR family transcriptional regulator [Paludibacteraceae bacterium]|nr:ArgR family transcriptional regulator [Paludibacteraceae bacterium]
MNMKMKRLRTVAAIINAQIIVSQEQLIRSLREQGIEVTQATLSRDLRDLRAEKKVLPDGTSKYVIPANPVVEKKVLGMDSDLAKMSIRSIDFCGQFAVVKTRPGYANAVAYDIDDRGGAYILGTIAGDDTILVIPKETTTHDELYDFLYDID